MQAASEIACLQGEGCLFLRLDGGAQRKALLSPLCLQGGQVQRRLAAGEKLVAIVPCQAIIQPTATRLWRASASPAQPLAQKPLAQHLSTTTRLPAPIPIPVCFF